MKIRDLVILRVFKRKFQNFRLPSGNVIFDIIINMESDSWED